MKTNKYLLTATPPTTNGDLHLGHISGPYLGADIYKRARELSGDEVLYICSTDDNQSYLLTKAFQENRTPKEVVDDYSGRIARSLTLANIKLDAFTSPDTELHRRYVQDFFMDLYNENHINLKEMEHCYCEQCDQYLYEAFIKGKCPNCLSPSGGNFCEECGNPNDPLGLVEAHCTLCGSTPVIISETIFVFPLEPLREQLTEYYNENNHKWRPHLRTWYKNLLSEKLIDVPVSNISDWGVRVPIEGFSSQAINVWFEMLPGHWATLASVNQESEVRWGRTENSNGVNIIQFFGFDNSFYYAVLHTAMLLVKGYSCADTFVINEFYQLDNSKFSTSRKHAIWASDFFQHENSDVVRFFLSLTGPEDHQTNFSLSEFERFKSEFVGSELITFLERGINSNDSFQDEIIDIKIRQLKEHISYLYNTSEFSPRRAAERLQAFVCDVNKSNQNSNLTLAAFLICAYPIMPALSERLWQLLVATEQLIRWDSQMEIQSDTRQKAFDFLISWSRSINGGELIR